MAATFRASTNASTLLVAAQTLTVNCPAGAAAGDYMIARIHVQGGTAASVMAPTGWALVRRIDDGTAQSLFIYTRCATAAEPASWNWVFDSARNVVGEITAYYNNTAGHYVRLIAESGNSTANGTNHATPALTANIANCEVVTAFGVTGNTNWTPPAGETEREDVSTTSAANDITLEAADEFQAGTGTTGTKTATSGAAGTGVVWIGLLGPDGVYQPNGTGGTIFVYDDANAAAGSATGFTFDEINLAYGYDFEQMVGKNSAVAFSTAVRKIYLERITITLGGQGSDGTNATTITATLTELFMATSLTYRVGGGTIRTNLGTKRGVGPSGTTPATMAGVQGVGIHAVGALTLRGDIYAYGGVLTSAGVLSILTTGASDQEIAGNIIRTGNNAVIGDSATIGKHYNNIIVGVGTVNVVAGFLVAEADSILMVGNPSTGSIINSTTATVANYARVRFGGSPLTSDMRLTAADLSGIKLLSPRWSGNGASPRFSTSTDHTVDKSPKQHQVFNTKVVDKLGNAISGVVMLMSSDIDGSLIDLQTASDGDLSFTGAGNYPNGVLVAELYRSGGVMLRRDRIFTLKVNQPGSINGYAVKSQYGEATIVFTWPGKATGDYTDINAVITLDDPGRPAVVNFNGAPELIKV